MPASPDVAPSSYLPKMATIFSVPSSHTLLYSGNLPVVLIGDTDSDAVVLNTSAAVNVQPERSGRK